MSFRVGDKLICTTDTLLSFGTDETAFVTEVKEDSYVIAPEEDKGCCFEFSVQDLMEHFAKEQMTPSPSMLDSLSPTEEGIVA